MGVKYRIHILYGHMMKREEHCVGRMTTEMYGGRDEGLIYDGWIECAVISKRRDCQGGSVRPSYIILYRRTTTHQKVGPK